MVADEHPRTVIPFHVRCLWCGLPGRRPARPDGGGQLKLQPGRVAAIQWHTAGPGGRSVDRRRPGLQGRLRTLRSGHRPRPKDEGSLHVAHISISRGNGERKRVRRHGDPALAGNWALDQLRADIKLRPYNWPRTQARPGRRRPDLGRQVASGRGAGAIPRPSTDARIAGSTNGRALSGGQTTSIGWPALSVSSESS
jgi:hypothetical protein